jgi:uncharacterized protein YkwD
VVASFTVTPEHRSQSVAVPPEPEATLTRVELNARGGARWLREADFVDPSPSPTAAPSDDPPAALVPQSLGEVAPDPEPEATPARTPAPTARPTPPAPPSATVSNPSTGWAEQHMLELINASRARAGLVPLAMDGGVANVARTHSAAEARVGYVYHDGADGTAQSRDVPACGTGWYGENTGKIWNDNVDALHLEFMAEPWAPINHRTNIMDPYFRRVGIGAVIGPDAMYMTVVFCR